MIRNRWRTHLKGATSEQQVLDLVRQYLAELGEAEIAELPKAAWHATIDSKRDVTQWTFRLGELHAEYRGEAKGLALLQELLLFFTHASVRITQVSSGATDRQPSEGGEH